MLETHHLCIHNASIQNNCSCRGGLSPTHSKGHNRRSTCGLGLKSQEGQKAMLGQNPEATGGCIALSFREQMLLSFSAAAYIVLSTIAIWIRATMATEVDTLILVALQKKRARSVYTGRDCLRLGCLGLNGGKEKGNKLRCRKNQAVRIAILSKLRL